VAARRWIKGNTHTHTTYSDGDSPPEVVVDWYAGHGYDFLFLTDHNAVIPDDHLARLRRRGLAVWAGEEITMAAVHVNGLGLRRVVMPDPGCTGVEESLAVGRAERVRWAVEQVRSQGGVATVNHPNFGWALGADELLSAGDFNLLEIANGNHRAENDGDERHPSTERLWDHLLTADRPVWAVASDDAHHFASWGPERANPGRGWLRVDAGSDRLHDCLEALRRGHFYATTGLELEDYRASPKQVVLELAADAARIDLVGAHGRVLDTIRGASARFTPPQGMSPYVRVRAEDPAGHKLWTQPVFL
jgi:predicted metal-dependent phosphoesterase TrpH